MAHRLSHGARDLARGGPLRRLDPIRKVFVIGTAIITLMLGATVAVALQRYRVEIAESARELRTLDLLLAEETARSMQSVSLVLDSVVEQIAQTGIASSADLATQQATHEIHEQLRARVAGIPQLDAITVIGSDGRLINFSRYWPVPDVRLDDRDYYQFLRSHAVSAAFLSKPVLNRGSGTPTVYLARRLQAPDGTFLGLVLAAIELTYFERRYDALHLSSGNLIALWRQDGTLLAQYPPNTAGSFVAAEAIRPDSATWSAEPGVRQSDGGAPQPRIVASQAVEGYPMQVDVGRRTSIVLHDWRREVVAVSLFVAVAIACVVVMMWALTRRFTAYEAASRAARERESAILAQRDAEDALRQAQKMEAVGQLTGGVAHDFNNLLTVITSSVELLRRDGLDAERRSRYVDAIGDASQRATKLTGQLLAFARRQALHPEVFDVVENVSVVGQMIDRLTGTRIHLSMELPETPLHVNADANQFDTAIVNLAVNARDAMPDGGRLTISVRCTEQLPATSTSKPRAGAFVTVAVSDTGGGIAPDLRDRIFEPFFTTKQVGQGTGLGLSQVIGFAKQSGGEVSLESIVGQGSTFTLHLPCVAGQALPMRERGEPQGIVDGRGARVLVVEDDPEVARLTAQMLRELKYFSLTTASAEEALALLDDDPDGFDAVLSDVVMPGMDGLTLAAEIGRRFSRLPVVLSTGYSAELVERGAGANRLLAKPYDLTRLSQALGTAMADKSKAGPDRKPTVRTEAQVDSMP